MCEGISVGNRTDLVVIPTRSVAQHHESHQHDSKKPCSAHCLSCWYWVLVHALQRMPLHRAPYSKVPLGA